MPPDTGIVHQVNLEYLARVVCLADVDGVTVAYPDTLVGTDSHTTMVNGLGVVGWGVGGIEAEAAMLGQPSSMLIPQVRRLPPDRRAARRARRRPTSCSRSPRCCASTASSASSSSSTARASAHLTIADRATLGNMCPEYGATVAIFPIDEMTLDYLRLTGRDESQVALVEAYAKAQGLFRTTGSPDAIVLGDARARSRRRSSRAWPVRSVRRIACRSSKAKAAFQAALPSMQVPAKRIALGSVAPRRESAVAVADPAVDALDHGAVVIAAITSCTNTSNPSVMIGAGLLAKKAVEKGLTRKPWVKSSLAPGSKVVTEYLECRRPDAVSRSSSDSISSATAARRASATADRCPTRSRRRFARKNLVVCSVLSGNRNFEGRIQQDVRANYLASPPLVVAYALAGWITTDITTEPLGHDPAGTPVYLKDIWPTEQEMQETMLKAVTAEMFRRSYADVFRGDERWQSLPVPEGSRFAWDDELDLHPQAARSSKA